MQSNLTPRNISANRCPVGGVYLTPHAHGRVFCGVLGGSAHRCEPRGEQKTINNPRFFFCVTTFIMLACEETELMALISEVFPDPPQPGGTLMARTNAPLLYPNLEEMLVYTPQHHYQIHD